MDRFDCDADPSDPSIARYQYVHEEDEDSVELRLRSDSECGGLPVLWLDGRGLLAPDRGLCGGSHSGLDVKPGGSGGGDGLTKWGTS